MRELEEGEIMDVDEVNGGDSVILGHVRPRWTQQAFVTVRFSNHYAPLCATGPCGRPGPPRGGRHGRFRFRELSLRFAVAFPVRAPRFVPFTLAIRRQSAGGPAGAVRA